jgi:hypothetical protein
MGGAVSGITKPITKLASDVLGGGGGGGSPVSVAEKVAQKASRFDEELAARRRGARRRGAMLMSDARLNPEAGTETLGGGGGLGQ